MVHKVDMSSALRRWAESAVVHQVPGIKRAFVVAPKSDGDDVVIKTEGVNINAMFDHSKTLDLNRLYCNDIHAMAEHYGVEAASRVIVKVCRPTFAYQVERFASMSTEYNGLFPRCRKCATCSKCTASRSTLAT